MKFNPFAITAICTLYILIIYNNNYYIFFKINLTYKLSDIQTTEQDAKSR